MFWIHLCFSIFTKIFMFIWEFCLFVNVENNCADQIFFVFKCLKDLGCQHWYQVFLVVYNGSIYMFYYLIAWFVVHHLKSLFVYIGSKLYKHHLESLRKDYCSSIASIGASKSTQCSFQCHVSWFIWLMEVSVVFLLTGWVL